MSQVTVEIMSADRASSFAKSMTSVYNFWKGFVVLIFRVIYSFKYTHLKMVNAGLWQFKISAKRCQIGLSSREQLFCCSLNKLSILLQGRQSSRTKQEIHCFQKKRNREIKERKKRKGKEGNGKGREGEEREREEERKHLFLSGRPAFLTKTPYNFRQCWAPKQLPSETENCISVYWSAGLLY